jgi:lipopolysaccharide biosynthesis glycosyltransferase
MIIVCTIDNNYIRHCAVMLRSLRDCNPGDDLSVYIVHQRMDPEERARLAVYLDGFLPSVSFLQIDPGQLQDFPVHGHISIATYFRLLLPAVLPAGLDRILFMDCDVIVNDSLSDLWNTPLGDYPMAAVSDHHLDMKRQRIGLGPESPYFNGGMLLIRLSAWRQENVLSRGLEYARLNAAKLEDWDQDVLNHLFENRCLMLDERWNAMSHPWRMRYREILGRTPWAGPPLAATPPPRLVRIWRQSLFRGKCLARDLASRFSLST